MGDRTGQWIGDGKLQTIASHGAGSVSDIISLLPTSSIVEVAANVVFERTIVTFQIRRISNTQLEGLAWMMWDGDVLSGTTTPVEALDPLSLSTFSWAHKSIMQFGSLPVPALIRAAADDTLIISQEVVARQIDVNVKRKISRRNQQVNLVIRSDLSNVVKVFTTFRTYYTYAG